jgi:hypothetical protein
VSGRLHVPAALPPGKSPGTHFIGGWVDPIASLDDMEKWKFFTLPGLELSPLLVVQPVASRYTDELFRLNKICIINRDLRKYYAYSYNGQNIHLYAPSNHV